MRRIVIRPVPHAGDDGLEKVVQGDHQPIQITQAPAGEWAHGTGEQGPQGWIINTAGNIAGIQQRLAEMEEAPEDAAQASKTERPTEQHEAAGEMRQGAQCVKGRPRGSAGA